MWWGRPTDVRPEHVTLLDATERERHGRYLRDEDRNRFTIGVVLTRLIFSAELGIAPDAVPIDRTCEDCGKPHGKPRLRGGAGPHVSVSHSGDRIAVAMSPHGPLGVDVEATGRLFSGDLSRHVLSETERQRSAANGLPTYWTRKEAVLKATGDGLRMAMTGLTLSGPDEPPRLLAWDARPDHVERITMHTLDPGPGYVACLALVDQPYAQIVEEPASVLLDAMA